MITENQKLEKPLFRGHSHQAAFFFALGVCIMLISRASNTKTIIAALIYSLSLIGLFGISALYHRPTWKPKQRMWMRRLDHAAIYVLIAGTSTPICLLALGPETGIKLLQLVWGAALFGIFQSLVWVNGPKWVSSVLYVIAGGLILPFMRDLQRALSEYQIQLIIVGGILYIAGALIYALKRPNPSPKYFGYHEIFHLLVIAGAALHFLAVNTLIR
jgi:hemolysin III